MDHLANVAKYRGVFDTPPKLLPAGNVDVSGNGRWRIWEFAGTKVDAPMLGNGDMLAAFAGPPQWPQFWLSTNDFWQMESNPNWEFYHDNDVAKRDPPVAMGSPKPLGRIVFDIPALEGAEYSAWQQYDDAVTCARYTLADGRALSLKSWVAATENELIVEFQGDLDCEIGLSFFFPDEIGKGCDTAVDIMGDCDDDRMLGGTFVGLVGGRPVQMRGSRAGVLWGYREFSERVDVPTRLAYAARFLGRDTDTVAYRGGEVLRCVIALRSWAKTSRPMEYARSRARWITDADIDTLWARHTDWWARYWGVSGVALDDPQIMRFYYVSQYMLGSLSRDPDYPPNILGICTFDRMAWNGNYKINYNHQSPFLGLLAAGRYEQSDPHDAPYLAMMDIGQEMCRRLLGHPGVYLPLGLGPVGMVSEALLLYMKSPAVHGALNMMMRWRLSMDKEYLRRVYPFLRAVAEFWAYDLVDRDGVLHTSFDGMHERITRDIVENGPPEDATNTLGYVRSFFRDIIGASEALGLDEDRRAAWTDIGQRLAPYRVGTIADIEKNPTLWAEGSVTVKELVPEPLQHVPVFMTEGKGGSWSLNFPANVLQIYPSGAIGLDSPPQELETARNTIQALSEMEHALVRMDAGDGQVRRRGAWNAGNVSCLFFPAAVRVGHDPEEIIRELKTRLTRAGLANGYVDRNPHGIENLSTVPNTIQEMMLLSHEGTMRFFRVWPRALYPDASFFGLRAYGGFVVSAKLAGGEVESASISSLAGGVARIENPWPSGRLSAGGKVYQGDIVEIPLREGETIEIREARA